MAQESTLSETLPREPAEARLSRLYRDHGREITGYALRRAAGPEDAADVVAETFLVAWRRLVRSRSTRRRGSGSMESRGE